ncbi:hypothetical protein [uncultured Castellaniella sp.]|uniref:hypothetical protein n=1 Tax=uncultured Castellaniella sp. TaxID=647907 RepID=UPI002638CDDD|nr:hypothetical protein [uncultured Castellaniella sp.]
MKDPFGLKEKLAALVEAQGRLQALHEEMDELEKRFMAEDDKAPDEINALGPEYVELQGEVEELRSQYNEALRQAGL